MATFPVPGVQIHQIFNTLPQSVTQDLRPLIVGPQAGLHRYSDADEKPTIDIGSYDPDNDTIYTWPDKALGSKIDTTYTKVFVENGLLRYFEDLTGIGSTIAPVVNRANWVRSDSLAFQTANGVNRSVEFFDRDVQLGDAVRIRGIDGSDLITLDTYVKGFSAEQIPSTIDPATAEANNQATVVATTNIDKIGGGDNNVTISADGTSFDGLAIGLAAEYYTIEVIQSSVAADFETARLRVTSASGLDNDLVVIPSPAGVPTAIGSLGLMVTFDLNETPSGSSEAELDGISPDDLVTGQKYRVYVRQNFTAPVATSGGTYTGPTQTTYIVTVLKGGIYASSPTISVVNVEGTDFSGPTVVPASATPTQVGRYGVTIAFSGTALRAGDKYYIEVTPVTDGRVSTLVLGHNLPAGLQGAVDLDLELFIKKNFQLEELREGFAPLVNWEQDQVNFTTFSGAIAYDPTWTDNGVQLPLDLRSGTLFLEYREWLAINVSQVLQINAVEDIFPLVGTISPDNPLAYAASKAIAGSGGADVLLVAINDPDDLDDWSAAIDLVSNDDFYNMVPLTYDKAVHDLFQAHVTTMSSPENGKWRACFFPLKLDESVAIVSADSSDNQQAVLATLSDDNQMSGTQYTRLDITSGNAELASAGVRVGDTVRYLFSVDGFGRSVYSTFTVAEVRSENTLILETGHSVAVSVAQKVEVWRNPTRTESAQQIANKAAAYGDRRVCAVWPDRARSGGVWVDGYHICAALAGLRGGSPPHQGLTNVQVPGFDDMFRSFEFFSIAQLDTIANSGGWIVTQDRLGQIFTRHAVTTDVTDLNTREEMIRANVDSICIFLLAQLKPLIGRTNTSDDAIDQIKSTIRATLEFLRNRSRTASLGGQLSEYDIISVTRSAISADRVIANIRITVPAPLNYLDVYIEI